MTTQVTSLEVGDVLKIPTGQFRLTFGDSEDPMEYEYRAVLALVPNLKIAVTSGVGVSQDYTGKQVFIFNYDLASVSAIPYMAAERHKVEGEVCHGLAPERGTK